MAILIVGIVAFFLGVTIGTVFGVNTARTTRTIESTNTRHTREFSKTLREIDQRLAAMPEELVDAVREAFPQLYNGPEE